MFQENFLQQRRGSIAGWRREELRVVCGAQGNPGTVAPFRAWRGSRDLVAQSPKLHSPAAARFTKDKAMLREKSLAQALHVPEIPSRDVRNLRESLWKSPAQHDT